MILITKANKIKNGEAVGIAILSEFRHGVFPKSFFGFKGQHSLQNPGILTQCYISVKIERFQILYLLQTSFQFSQHARILTLLNLSLKHLIINEVIVILAIICTI